MPKVVDISQGIIDDLSDTTNISLPSVATYLRQNIGRLNDLINSNFIIQQGTLEIVDGTDGVTLIGDLESALYSQLYEIYYFQRRANSVLGVVSIDTVIQYQSDGGVIRQIDRNQIARTYLDLKKDAEEQLKSMVNKYKLYTIGAVQIIGSDLVHHTFPLSFLRRNLLT